MTGAEALVEALRKEKARNIFGFPGGAILPVYDALYDSDIRHILMRHEQCAAHAADGYARASGLVGVCMATSGPGATNLVTGIANAYMDSSPIVAFTGQVTSTLIGKDAFQEADIVGITTPITKCSFVAKKAADIPRIVKTAFHVASSGRKGPVLVDLPKDVQAEKTDVSFDGAIDLRGYRPAYEPSVAEIAGAVNLLQQAQRPMILAGGGVITANACSDLVALAELLQAPVATTLMGKGSIPEDHFLSLGMIGMHGTASSNLLVNKADVLLAIGTRFSDRTTGKLDDFCPEAQIIHADIDVAEIGKNVRYNASVVGDAGLTLRAIYRLLVENYIRREETVWTSRVEQVKDWKQEEALPEDCLRPVKVLRVLRNLLPSDTIVTTEVGQNQMWAALYFRATQPRRFISSGGLGTMGFGFPAALGAKVACPGLPVVDIAGDGSFLMTEQDLATSIMSDIPVVVVVLNNSVLGLVAQWQRLFYNRRYSQINLGNVPDFVKLAEAYGAHGVRVETYTEFERAVKQALRTDVTTVIDVPIPMEENVFPMVPAGSPLRDILSGGAV